MLKKALDLRLSSGLTTPEVIAYDTRTYAESFNGLGAHRDAVGSSGLFQAASVGGCG